MEAHARRCRLSTQSFSVTIVLPQSTKGYVVFKGQNWKVPEAFLGERLAIRPLSADGRYGVFFASHQITTIDLTER